MNGFVVISYRVRFFFSTESTIKIIKYITVTIHKKRQRLLYKIYSFRFKQVLYFNFNLNSFIYLYIFLAHEPFQLAEKTVRLNMDMRILFFCNDYSSSLNGSSQIGLFKSSAASGCLL